MRKEAQIAPRLKIVREGEHIKIVPDSPHEEVSWLLLMNAFATADPDLFIGLLDQLRSVAVQDGELRDDKLKFLFSIVKANEPTDPNEALLVSEMATIHSLAMETASQLANAKSQQEYQLYVGALNKLARTFAAQMQALKRYRSGGKQKVTVQTAVAVSDGGQAIVGNVTQTTVASENAPTNASAAAPLPINDAKAVPMQPVNESEEPLPAPVPRYRYRQPKS